MHAAQDKIWVEICGATSRRITYTLRTPISSCKWHFFRKILYGPGLSSFSLNLTFFAVHFMYCINKRVWLSTVHRNSTQKLCRVHNNEWHLYTHRSSGEELRRLQWISKTTNRAVTRPWWNIFKRVQNKNEKNNSICDEVWNSGTKTSVVPDKNSSKDARGAFLHQCIAMLFCEHFRITLSSELCTFTCYFFSFFQEPTQDIIGLHRLRFHQQSAFVEDNVQATGVLMFLEMRWYEILFHCLCGTLVIPKRKNKAIYDILSHTDFGSMCCCLPGFKRSFLLVFLMQFIVVKISHWHGMAIRVAVSVDM